MQLISKHSRRLVPGLMLIALAGCAGVGSRQALLEAQLAAAEQEAAALEARLAAANQGPDRSTAAAAAAAPSADVGANAPQAEANAMPAERGETLAATSEPPPRSIMFDGPPQVWNMEPTPEPATESTAEPAAQSAVELASTAADSAAGDVPVQPDQPPFATTPAPTAATPTSGLSGGPGSQPPPPPPADFGGELPPNPRPGECYARLYIAPTYESREEQVVSREAYERIELVPAEYQDVERRVLITPAHERVVKVVPPVYENRREDVVVRAGYDRVEQVPAEYADVEEKILVKPAHTVWKRGRGPIERLDAESGEILCLVEVPAEYKTVTKRVLKTPATTRRIAVPPELESVETRVLVKPAQIIKETVPAQYKTVTTREIRVPASERRIPVPAEYQTVTQQLQLTPARSEWRSILCETNATPPVIKRIQQALADRGYNPGRIDGVIGSETRAAARAFQRREGLAEGQLSMETVRALNVDLSGL